jgi:hypothetical protein
MSCSPVNFPGNSECSLHRTLNAVTRQGKGTSMTTLTVVPTPTVAGLGGPHREGHTGQLTTMD